MIVYAVALLRRSKETGELSMLAVACLARSSEEAIGYVVNNMARIDCYELVDYKVDSQDENDLENMLLSKGWRKP